MTDTQYQRRTPDDDNIPLEVNSLVSWLSDALDECGAEFSTILSRCADMAADIQALTGKDVSQLATCIDNALKAYHTLENAVATESQ